MFKHKIEDVFVFRNGMVAVTDQNGEQMSFFQGRQDEAMFKIKRRIERQKPCTIKWNIQEGANFSGTTGPISY